MGDKGKVMVREGGRCRCERGRKGSWKSAIKEKDKWTGERVELKKWGIREMDDKGVMEREEGRSRWKEGGRGVGEVR